MILPHTREMVRVSLLRYAEASGARGVSQELLFQFIRTEFRKEFQSEDLGNEIHYLADKGFLAPVSKSLSPENRIWRVSAEGRDWLAEQKLEEG